jgi:parallel beta-helix repeat protein
VLGARNVTMRGVRVEWTGEPSAANGAYGIYPVQCENVLLENCTAIGASDAGLYVGQCRNVVVRSCRAEKNVAGIEIENTVDADVYDNVATNNTGGILVFDMPGLQLKAGSNVRVFQNRVTANNHFNFADPGGVVAAVPPGTGVMVMATDHVEVFDNDIEQNDTGSVLIVSYLAVDRKINDPNFDPVPEYLVVRDNRISAGGTKPAGTISELLKPVLGEQFPDIMWDGVVNPERPQPTISLTSNGSASFVNFNLAKLTPENVQSGNYAVDTDITGMSASLEPLPTVILRPFDAAAVGSPAVHVYRSVPKKLSEYGFFEGSMADQKPVSGVRLYDLNMPLFSDYSTKRRFIRVPEGGQIGYRDQGVLEFPVETVIAKTFSYPRDMTDAAKGERILETRVELLRHDGWYGVTYLWNQDQTDADLALGGSEVEVDWIHSDGQARHISYQVPNANQCLNCHSQNRSFVPIGPTARNLNRSHPAGGDLPDQLTDMQQTGMLSGLPDISTVSAFPRLDDPHSGTAETRARAWLDVNCAHCHNPEGTARTSGLDLRQDQADMAKFGFWKAPVAAGKGSGGRKYDIVPGRPDESILLFRMESQDPGILMPSVGRTLVHTEAVAMVREWIQGLPAAEPPAAD